VNRILRTGGAVVVLVFGAIGAGYLIRTKPQPVPVPVREQAWPVAVQRVEIAAHTPSVTLFGRTESAHLARLSAGTTADVVSVAATEGDLVQRGTTLVALDARDATLRLRQSEADLAELRAELLLEAERQRADKQGLTRDKEMLNLAHSGVERAQELARRNLGSRSQLDASRQEETRQRMAIETRMSTIRSAPARGARLQARVAKAQATRDQAALDVERTIIVAPFDARILNVSVATGDRVRAGDPLVDIFDYKRVEVRAQVPTRYLPNVRASLENATLLLAVIAIDGAQLNAKLVRLSAQSVEARGGVDALFHLERTPHWLGLGRTVELTLALGTLPDTAAVPLESLYGESRVFKVVDDRMVGIEITRLGEYRSKSGATLALIEAPELRAGDQIVTTNLPNAIDGLRVKALSK
jgi:multidrug efflux pump subunit AcrA (membrane-fusion protein)